MKHPGYKIVLMIGALIVSSVAFSQDIDPGSPFNAPVLSNPAFTGSHTDGLLTLSYRDFYPGNDFNIASLFVSYDSFFEPVHGGLGIYILENHLGNTMDDIRSAITYSYHLRATKDLFINAGFKASVIHRSINRSSIVFPDQIDPLLGPVLISAENLDQGSMTVFDAGVGFLFRIRELQAGISVDHLAKPDLSLNKSGKGRLGRHYLFHVSSGFNLSKDNIKITPVLYSGYQDHFFLNAIGLAFGYKMLTISNILQHSNFGGITAIESGINVELDRIGLSYSYLMSLNRHSGTLPGSLSNHVTIYIRLNNVDKSTVINAINFPKL